MTETKGTQRQKEQEKTLAHVDPIAGSQAIATASEGEAGSRAGGRVRRHIKLLLDDWRETAQRAKNTENTWLYCATGLMNVASAAAEDFGELQAQRDDLLVALKEIAALEPRYVGACVSIARAAIQEAAGESVLHSRPCAELLNALKLLYQKTRVPAMRDDDPYMWSVLDAVEAAITKAEGGH